MTGKTIALPPVATKPAPGGAKGRNAGKSGARRVFGLRDHAPRGRPSGARKRWKRATLPPLRSCTSPPGGSTRSAAGRRWTSPKKVKSHTKAEADRGLRATVTPAIEPLPIPFEGHDIKLWLQKPAGAAEPPVTINIGGSDLWKDSVQVARAPPARDCRHRRAQARHHRRAGAVATRL
jgi:hypothetical protein